MGYFLSSLRDFSRRLLLRQAMQRTGTEHEINGMNADDRPVLEQFAQNAERNAVVWIIERRDNDAGVGDVEIHIACWQAPTVKVKRCWHGQRHDFGF